MNPKYFFIIFLMLILINAAAQEIPYQDTIKITVDDRLAATIAFSNYKVFIKGNSVFEDLGTLKTNILKAKTEIPIYQSYKIEYVPGKSLIIKEGENKRTYQLKNNVFETLNYTYQCNLYGKDYNMFIVFSELSDLTNVELKSRMEKWEQSLQNAHFPKNIVSTRDESKIGNVDSLLNDSSIVKFTLFPVTQKKIQFILEGGVGAALIKNQPLNSISVTSGLRFRTKGIILNDFFLTLRNFPTFNNNQIQTNNILSFGWRSNISHNNIKQNWLGIELGRVVKNEADFFGENRNVMGLSRQYGKLTVVPEIYFTGFIKKVYPGLRIEFRFY